MSSSPTEIITVRQIKGKPIIEESFDSRETSNNTLDEESYEEQAELSNNLLCILYRVGKLGAAYYNFTDKQLYVYEEMLEAGPQYLTTVSLFREIQPKNILTIGGKSEIFVRILSEIITYGESCLNSTTTTDTIPVPKNLYLVSLQEYSYEICKEIISQLNLAEIEDEPTDIKREVYIHSLINFDNRISIQALGTLVKYLEKNWKHFGITEKNDLCYIHINQISRKNHVLIDNSTFQSLQIFSKRAHDSGFKRGLNSSEREGLSLYKLFSLNCKSKVGLLALKNMLLKPLNNIDILNNRLDFIEFVLEPCNREFVENIRDNLRFIASDINVILTRIENSMAKIRDWYVLYKTIYHTILIKEISLPYIEKCSILMDLYEKVSDNLLGLEKSINNGLDFDASKKRGKPIIKYGLDNILDEKKLRRQDIINDVMAAARFAAENLPDFLNECSVVYIPEMGHLIAIKEWEPNCAPEDLQHLGFHFVFKIGGRIHYKNPMCVELDKRLGDTISEIIDHENRILRRLSGFVIKYNRDIREPLKILGLIDCLISMAVTASSKLYVRPSLNQQNYFEMEECRHPLLEQVLEQFQPNDCYSGGPYSRMKIITGPNSSGKSVYLKEVSLIIYMAHVGSFVPCTKANINLFDSIYTRLLATESVAVRLSSFMIDLTQMSHALMDNSRSTLVFLDEFGKGTTDIEGIALLEGALKHFLSRGINCPHVMVATHFQKINQHLPESPLIQFQKMEHTNENGVLYFLYKITEGVSNSFAIDVAEATLIDKEVIERARYYFDCIINEKAVAPLKKIQRRNNLDPYNLERLNVPEPEEGGSYSNRDLQHLEDEMHLNEDVINLGENELYHNEHEQQQDEYEQQQDDCHQQQDEYELLQNIHQLHLDDDKLRSDENETRTDSDHLNRETASSSIPTS